MRIAVVLVLLLGFVRASPLGVAMRDYAISSLAGVGVEADTFKINIFVQIFSIILMTLGLVLGTLGMVFPSGLPASMVQKGEMKNVVSEEVVNNPNIFSWGAGNVALIMPIIVALVEGTRSAWLVALITQVFRDLPDTIAEFVIKLDYPTGIAFSFFVAADIGCIMWIVVQGDTDPAFDVNIWVALLHGALLVAHATLGGLAIFNPDLLPARVVSKGDFKKPDSDDVVSHPNLYSWGVRRLASTVCIVVAIATGKRDAWLIAVTVQVFRDLLDLIGYCIRGDIPLGLAYFIILYLEVAAREWLAAQGHSLPSPFPDWLPLIR